MRLFEEKWRFIHTGILASCRLASFQRANVYASDATDDQHLQLHKELDAALSELGRQYSARVSEEQHVRNIAELADRLSNSSCGRALAERTMRVGVAQKALNLYLKYLWCLRRIPMPPHCPFDSRIIGLLPSAQQLPWTKIKNSLEYETLVVAAKTVANPTPLAEWELIAYETLSNGG